MTDKDINQEDEPKKEEKDIREKADEMMDKVSDGAKKAGAKAGEALDQFAEGAKKAGAKAGEVLGDFAEGTKKATVKVSEKAGDVMGDIISGVRKAGEKATDSVKIMEIKHEISQIETESKKILPKISEKVLALYAEDKIKDPELAAMCQEIKKNDLLIEDKKEQIETIKTTDNE